MLSNTCKTGIKAVIYLASKHKTDEKISVKEIADHIDASSHTVGKVLQSLVKQKVINSTKGPSGGFFINEKQLQQPIMVIINAIDGLGVFEECGLGLANCSSGHPCPIHKEYGAPRDMMKNIFDEKKIIDLLKPVTRGSTFLVSKILKGKN